MASSDSLILFFLLPPSRSLRDVQPEVESHSKMRYQMGANLPRAVLLAGLALQYAAYSRPIFGLCCRWNPAKFKQKEPEQISVELVFFKEKEKDMLRALIFVPKKVIVSRSIIYLFSLPKFACLCLEVTER